MAVQRIVVIGASSGGVEALRMVVGGLPAGFGAPVCVVIHRRPYSHGLIAGILDRSGPLRARDAASGDRLENGTVYVAPPDHHLLIEPGQLRLTRGPRENLSRPSVDPLFRSAAQVYGPAAIGVILTGDLDDGAAGLDTIRRLGGTTVVQDPADAFAPSMPSNALRYGPADFRVPLTQIPAVLTRLADIPASSPRVSGDAAQDVDVEVRIASEEKPMDTGLLEIAEPSLIACPECHGVLLRLKRAQPSRFRCHTGHAYSMESLVAAVEHGIEDSLWSAVRSLEEAGLLLRELSNIAVDERDTGARVRAEQTDSQAEQVREILLRRASLPAR